MKVLILTLGTQGDVQPYVALAKGLQNRQHEVSICTSAYFEKFIKAHHIDYQFMNNSFIELIHHSCSKTLLDGQSSLFQKIRSGFTVLLLSKKIMMGILIDTWQATINTKPDLIIAHPKVLSAQHICEKIHVPLIIASPLPTFEATKEFALIGLPQLSFLTQSQLHWYNKASYKLTQKAHHIFDKTINLFRQEQLALPPCNATSSPTRNHDDQPITHLHAFSPAVLAKPNDWRQQAYVSGYWFLDEHVNWQPP